MAFDLTNIKATLAAAEATIEQHLAKLPSLASLEAGMQAEVNTLGDRIKALADKIAAASEKLPPAPPVAPAA